MKREEGKKLIEQKVEDFEKNASVLKKKGHGETNIRSNYIDVFFEALGWNMKSHYDVHREYAQKDNSATKKVDYAFKINNKVKFFVEAKEANVDLVNDKDAIYQAKRYAYSTNGRAPVVILTDFEEFRVFNVVKAPVYDNTDRELLKKYSFEYTAYPENWDLLWDTFSKEAVTAGSLDALRGKIDKNTKTMDADFLEQITLWRETLARNTALRNKDLKVDELNEAVQRILDRLLFIRNLEDREIEPENTLLDKTKKSEDVYRSIIPVFRNLDNVYNGLLFKKHFSEELTIDDKTIKEIIKNMCYPVSPFQFDVIEPEILGRIYEKFLGSKIRLTENHQAKIEEKMEVRKAGGVYYTPEYIVNYIVENTVGRKLHSPNGSPLTPGGGTGRQIPGNSLTSPLSPKGGMGLTPDEIKSIKICDPACGSGSFLLGAYSYLLDYHEKWYAAASAEDKKKYKADFYKTKDGVIKVTLEKRGDILRNNIFGVDIDKEATEVAIMSLYLKMLDEGFDKGERDLFFIKGHVLPDMTENVKCGNSLIGTDYFDGKLEIDISEMKEIKPFDWEKEFKEVFSRRDAEGAERGGFDCVIGNPPWVDIKGLDPKLVKYYFEKYKTAENRINLYALFVEKSLNIVNKTGRFAFIIPNSILTQSSYTKIRSTILSSFTISSIVRLPDNVFENVKAETCVIVLTNKSKTALTKVILYKINDNIDIIDELARYNVYETNQSLWEDGTLNIFNIFTDDNKIRIIKKIENNKKALESFCEFSLGITPYDKYKGHTENQIKNRVFHSTTKTDQTFKELLTGEDIKRYYVSWGGKEYISYGDWLGAARRPEFFTGEKIFVRQIVSGNPLRIYASYSDEEYYITQIGFSLIKNIEVNLKFILSILNSNLMNFYHTNKYLDQSKNLFQKILIQNAKQFPFPVIDFEKQSDKSIHDTLVSLVDQMLTAQKDCRAAKSDNDKKLHEQKISMLDKKIDDLVYKLYGLTDEEIGIVEG